MRRPHRTRLAVGAAVVLLGSLAVLAGPGSAADLTTVSVVAIADAHVRNGGAAGTSFGHAEVLEVKSDTVYGYSRQAFLTFPVPGAFEPLRATVHLTGRVQKGTLTLAAHEVGTGPNDLLDEATLTWDRRPALGAELGQATVAGTVARVVELDVTAAVQQARRDGRRTVTIGLRATTTGEPLFSAASREAAADRPLLVLVHP